MDVHQASINKHFITASKHQSQKQEEKGRTERKAVRSQIGEEGGSGNRKEKREERR